MNRSSSSHRGTGQSQSEKKVRAFDVLSSFQGDGQPANPSKMRNDFQNHGHFNLSSLSDVACWLGCFPSNPSRLCHYF